MTQASARGGSAEAGRLFRAALEHERRGEVGEAVARLEAALALDPAHGPSLRHLGVIAHRAGRYDLAERFFGRAVEAEPTEPSARLNLGLALLARGDRPAAVAALEAAVSMDPASPEGWFALAAARHQAGREEPAAEAYARVLELQPGHAQALANFGNLRREQGRPGEAAALLGRAAALDPASAVTHRNLALALRDAGLALEADASFARALELAPDFAAAQSEQLYGLNYREDLSAEEIAERHRAWGRRLCATPPPRPAPQAKGAGRPLRVGYVSGDLHAHPVGFFFSAVIANHDRKAVEAICYSNGSHDDAFGRQIRAASWTWRPIEQLSDADVVEQVRADGVDILVDLSGHAAKNRLAVFARRAAPLQVAWLGYVATTGLPTIDHVLMDEATTPEGAEAQFSERLVRLPRTRFCYAPPKDAPAVTPRPDRPVTFGAFGQVLKLQPQVIRVWARVLGACPAARLVLKWPAFGDEAVRTRIAAAFAAHGVDPARLEFRGRSSQAETLAQYADIDIALDPFPFCGGATTCEALWMGVPTVTWPQARPASRQSLAILQLIGAPELAAGGENDYVAIAAALAADTDRLAAYRAGLRATMAASPLCDGPGFTRGLEATFWRLWAETFPV